MRSGTPDFQSARQIDMLIKENELIDNDTPDQFYAECFSKDKNNFTRPAEDSLLKEMISRDFGLFENLIAKFNDSLLQGKELISWLVYDK